MSYKVFLAAIALPLICACANAADLSVVGKWEGKSKNGKVIGLEFKEDKSLTSTEDGKESFPEEAKAKWEMVDAAKGHLDIILTVEGKELRIPMLVEAKGDKIVIGGPKGETRAEKMADSDDPVEFTKK